MQFLTLTTEFYGPNILQQSQTQLETSLRNIENLLADGQAQSAIEESQTLLNQYPHQANALLLLGIAYAQLGDYANAIDKLTLAHNALPHDINIMSNLALALELGHQLGQAKSAYEKILIIDPTNLNACINLGDILRQSGDFVGSRQYLQQAIDLDPNSYRAWNNLGILFESQKDYVQAEKAFRKALDIQPNHPSCTNNLAGVLHKQDRYDESIKLLKPITDNHSDYLQAWVNIAAAYTMLYQYNEAKIALNNALKINRTDASTWNNLGKLKHDTGQFSEAISCYNQAIELSPDNANIKWHRSFSYLMMGDYIKGWYDYSAGLVTKDRNPFTLDCPDWNGKPLMGKSLFVSAEQGLGDEIMFASCLNDLRQTADNITYECDTRLLPIFRRSFPGCDFISRQEHHDEIIHADYQVPAGSLPGIFRVSLESFPSRHSYLSADSDRVDYWKQQYQSLGDGLKIGISWRGGTRVDPQKRSLPLEEWLSILTTKGTHFIDIQYGDTNSERTQFNNSHNIDIHHFDECDPLNEQDDFAAQLSALDLVISVSNATVHLAGALGVKTWSLLPFVPSWRWGFYGRHTPWYPSVYLFRQAKMNDWSSVVSDITEHLNVLVNNS